MRKSPPRQTAPAPPPRRLFAVPSGSGASLKAATALSSTLSRQQPSPPAQVKVFLSIFSSSSSSPSFLHFPLDDRSLLLLPMKWKTTCQRIFLLHWAAFQRNLCDPPASL